MSYLGRSQAVFLDRDGTLVRDVRHGADPAALELLPGAGVMGRALKAAGFKLIVVTNQSGVARGLFTMNEARATGRRLAALMRAAGAPLDGYYLCPTHPAGLVAAFAGDSECRKPAPGMLFRASLDLGIDLVGSWIIGDMLTDIGAGAAAGVRTVLIDIGAENLRPDDPRPAPTFVARSPAHAARLILGSRAQRSHLDAPLPLDVLMRPPAPPDKRSTGEPSHVPDKAWLRRAEMDALELELQLLSDREALSAR